MGSCMKDHEDHEEKKEEHEPYQQQQQQHQQQHQQQQGRRNSFTFTRNCSIKGIFGRKNSNSNTNSNSGSTSSSTTLCSSNNDDAMNEYIFEQQNYKNSTNDNDNNICELHVQDQPLLLCTGCN